MTVREIRLFGDPVLKSPCDPIKDFGPKTHALIEDLIDTTKVPGRAGVAANQIGISLRAFSYNVAGKVGYLINPKNLVLKGEPILVEEGCLSVPGNWHLTTRYPEAELTGTQLDGTEITISGTGLLAQALQHELDHLDGLLYLDRLTQEERKEAMKIVRKSDWFMN
jgi:peptide deformylase